ncbi:MAG: SagB/ThcOx family dehydrogenase [Spirochaetes bacterium]|nr:SagB/ThcOx family dehydrogenase [Spirochaetota bacterium]
MSRRADAGHSRRFLASVIAILLLCAAGRAIAQDDIRLPNPEPRRAVSLEEALTRVRQVREYSRQPLLLDELSYVLWAATGGRYDAVSTASRSYPSAGAIYPTRVYVLAAGVEGVRPGCYEYVRGSHELWLLKSGDLRRQAVEGSWDAAFVALAPATVILAADYESASNTFGERGRSLYVPVDVGHVSQTIRLAATAAGLVVGIAGEFDHARIKDILGIGEDPLLLLALGHPR